MKPTIIVNFKTYEQATGSRAESLAKMHEKVREESGADVMVAVQNADIHRVSSSVSIPVLAQHADPVSYGSNTGHDMPECLKENGAWGVLINHSEDRMPMEEIKKTIERCKEAGLKTIVCAENTAEGKDIVKMLPDYIAFEDPELIGTGRSVSANAPESVKGFSDMVDSFNREEGKEVVPLCGAGISTGDDVRKSIELGMHGVLVASAITKAENPESVLREFVA